MVHGLNNHLESNNHKGQLVFPPQKPIHVFFLVLATSGLYLCAYYYRHPRDLWRLDKQKTRPWLWVFAPLISIALPFATYRMTRRYAALAEEIGLSFENCGARLGWLAFGLFAVDGLYAKFIVEYSGLISVLILLFLSWTYFILTRSINTYKDTLNAVRLNSPAHRLTPAHWAVLIIGISVTGSLQGLVVYGEIAQALRPKVTQGKRWHHPELPFSIYIEDAWAVAEIGSFSDGSADAEFSASDQISVVIFDQTLNQGLDAIIDWRRSSIRDEYPNAACFERHWLQEGSLVRVAELYCEGRSFGDRTLQISTHFENGDRHFELLASATVTSLYRSRVLARLRRFSSGFRFEEPNAETP